MDLPHPARGICVSGAGQGSAGGGGKRGREGSSERWDPTKRALEGGRPGRKEGADREAAGRLGPECLEGRLPAVLWDQPQRSQRGPYIFARGRGPYIFARPLL